MGRQKDKRKGRDRYWEQVKELADEHGWSVAEARAQWSNYFTKGGKPRKKPKKPKKDSVDLEAERLITAETSGVTCPYCRLGFLPEESTYTCAGCQTKFHQECRQELRRCSTVGCAGVATTTTEQQRSGPIVIERDQLRRNSLIADRISAAVLITIGLVFLVAALFGKVSFLFPLVVWTAFGFAYGVDWITRD